MASANGRGVFRVLVLRASYWGRKYLGTSFPSISNHIIISNIVMKISSHEVAKKAVFYPFSTHFTVQSREVSSGSKRPRNLVSGPKSRKNGFFSFCTKSIQITFIDFRMVPGGLPGLKEPSKFRAPIYII